MARIAPFRDDRGAVYVEFLISFFPLFLMFLALCQLALLAAAEAVVRHAAYSAVRSAVVVLEDSPKKFDSARRGNLFDGDPARVAGIEDLVAKLGYGAGKKRIPASKKPGVASNPIVLHFKAGSSAAGTMEFQAGARMEPVRTAGYMPLITLAPRARLAQPGKETVASGLVSPTGAQLEYAMQYTKAAAAVAIQTSPEASYIALDSIGPNDAVTVKVSYAYHCSIPIVRALICRSIKQLAKSDVYMVRAGRELPNLVSPDARFKLLSATATLPNQGAEYERQETD